MSSETGILAVLNNVESGIEAEYDEWYQKEHVPERVGVPGFRSGRRFRARGCDPEYLSVYGVDSVGVLTSAAYLERLNAPTEWTQRIMPMFRDMRRCVCTVKARAGSEGMGGAATVCQLNVSADAAEGLYDWISNHVLTEIGASPGIVNAELWRIDAAASRISTTESDLRVSDREVPDWGVFVEGVDSEAVEVLEMRLSTASLVERGATNIEFLPKYQMLYALRA